MGVQPAPKLLWGDPAVGGSVAIGLLSDEGSSSAAQRRLAALRLVPAAPRQRDPHLGETGAEEVGRGPSVPGLHQEHPPPLALAQVLLN